MAKYRMNDDRIVDTDKAQQQWTEATYWNGSNSISKNTDSEWEHQTLFKSKNGNYYLENSSAYEGRKSTAEWVSMTQAAAWLVLNDHELPEDLARYTDEVSE